MLNSGRRGRRAPDGYGIQSVNEKFNQVNYPIPIIDSWAITDGSYNPTDDTALSTAGGQTVVVYGSGFTSGVTVNINGTNMSPVVLLDSNRLTFTSPALSSASYTMYVSNTDGATAIYVPGLVYSGVPNWSSPPANQSIGTSYETKNVSTLANTTFVATGDGTITYSIISGNLPSGVTLSSSGELSGTLPATASPTAYSFTIRATDAQNQDSDRPFTLTINPDAVTWVAPSLNGSLTVYETQSFSTPLSATSAAGYGVMYASNTLPTGITLNPSTGAFSGYANTVGATYAQLTATANTTGRYANSNVTFTVAQDVVTWSTPTNNTSYALNQGQAISNVTLSATSAAGYGVQYSANALPTGVSLSGSTISGTPTSTGTTYTQLTATSNTTNRSSYAYISWTVSIASDTYFNNTALLLSANSSIQTQSFVADNSINNSQLTTVGSVKPSNFNPYQPGYYSTYFNGTSSYMTLPASSNWDFGSGAFTVECWVLPSSVASDQVIAFHGWSGSGAYNYGWNLRLNATTGVLSFYVPTGDQRSFTDLTVKVGQWNHIAICGSGGVISAYLNGTKSTTTYAYTAFVDRPTMTLVLGGWNDNTESIAERLWFGGYVSNFRVNKGTALYTSSFTPPTAPLLPVTGTQALLCQSNKFEDKSVNNATVTAVSTPIIGSAHPFPTVYQAGTQYYSTSFNGSSDYLTLADNSAWVVDTDYTIEFWLNCNSFPGQYNNIISQRGGASSYWGINYDTSLGWALFWNNGSGETKISRNQNSPLNSWVHVAIVKSGTTGYMFLNGTQAGATFSFPSISDVSSLLYVGAWYTPGDYINGNLSNLRMVKGTALYTSNFTPSTTPLTAVANTVLLTCQDSTFKDNSSNNLTITAGTTTVKPTTVHPTVFDPTYYSSSFSGSNYLSVASNAAFAMGTNNFTIECWFNAVNVTGNKVLIDQWNFGSTRFLLRLSGTTVQSYFYTNTSQLISGGTVAANTWNHVALVRSGNTFTLYLNGTSIGTPITDSNGIASGTSTVGIGGYGGDYFTGYISNVRIVNGTAIVPPTGGPTSPLTAVTNTSLLTCKSSLIVDESTNVFAITNNSSVTPAAITPFTQPTGYSSNIVSTTLGSGYFNGSTDYLTASVPAVGTQSFTYEAWVYLTAGGSQRGILGSYVQLASPGDHGILLYVDTSNIIHFVVKVNNSSSIEITSPAAIPINSWVHIAGTRDNSSSCRLWINGVGGTPSTFSGNLIETTASIGSLYVAPSSMYFMGHITDARIVTGQAIYTSNFVPQFTGSLTNV